VDISTNSSPANARLEAIATACLIALIGGVLLPKALWVGLDRAILVWLVAQITCGVIVGAIDLPPRKVLWSCVFPSACVPIAYSGFLVVRWLVDLAKNPDAGFKIPIFGGSGVGFGPPTPTSLAILGALAFFAFVATYVLVSVSAFASRPVQRGIARLYKFGPSGVRRVQQIVVGVCAVVGALILLWGAFG
jgi:hypothetical protein